MIRFTRIVARDCFAYTLLDFNFIEGIHSIEGVNGSAKTSVFMTLMQGLFNRNAKGTKIDEVNNTITGKPYEIEVYFTKGSDEYAIINSRKAGTIEIYKNGKPKHVKRIPDNLKIIEDILGGDFESCRDQLYQSPKSSINLLEKDSDSSRKAFVNSILNLNEIDSSLEKFKLKDKELSGKGGQIELVKSQIRKFEEALVEEYELEQDAIDVSVYEKIRDDLNTARDNQQIELAKTRALIAQLKEDKHTCEKIAESLSRISVLEAYLNCEQELPHETVQELTGIHYKLLLEKQQLEQQHADNCIMREIIKTNNEIKKKRIALVEQIGTTHVVDSIESLTNKLDTLGKEFATLEATIKSNKKNLTNLLDYSTIDTCPTCRQKIKSGSLTSEIEELRRTIVVDESTLVVVHKEIVLYEQGLSEHRRHIALKQQIEVLEVSLKPCNKTERAITKDLTECSRRIAQIDEDLDLLSRRLKTRSDYEDAQQELVTLKSAPGAHLDYVAIVTSLDKMLAFSQSLREALTDIDEQVCDVQKTIKKYQEFNTVQRTIKAVNAQKRSFNDSTKAKLEALYKDLSSKEDQAALVKVWLQVLGPKGFRVHKIQNFLGHLNATMQKYSDMLSDGRIRCAFFIAEGEIDFSVTDCNKTIAWSCWSEGEKARVKMACLFAVLELLEVMGAVSFNVLALDEIFSALDHAGKEGLFKVLNYLKGRGKCLYTISHTPLALNTEYDSVISACKQDDGTTTITQ